MHISDGVEPAMAGSAKVKLRHQGKRLLLLPAPIRAAEGWNTRLAKWAASNV